MDWRSALADALEENVQFDVSMAKKVAFRIGGPADAFVRPHTSKQLATCMQIARRFDLPLTVLGTGSNVLISDRGIRGITLRLAGELAKLGVVDQDKDSGSMNVGAAALNPPVVAKALEHGLVGIEFLATIPGTFGGALIMNAGAHGGEIASFVEWVELIDGDLTVQRRVGADCGFEYRLSGFGPNEILTKSRLSIPKGEVDQAKSALQNMRVHRKKTQPIKEPNAGSLFKNPPDDFAGRMIEACGLKGKKIGGALISPTHANFIVNEDGATALDIIALAEHAQKEVLARFSVSLEWEVNRLGDWS